MMKNDIYLIGEVGWEITLKSVIDAVNASDKDLPLNVHIHSPGGSVYDGLAIYNFLKNLEQEVNTFSLGLVASIASIIFLSGKKENRSVNKTDSFLIHLPMNFGFGNAEDLEKNAKELRKIEDQLADIYVNETSLTKEEAYDLMKKDEMLDVYFLLDKGFVSEIVEYTAVANLNNKEMTKLTTEDKSWIDSKFAAIAKFFAPKNKIVQDATGTEIDFTGLAEDATPAVGDKAKVNGEDAAGEYLMPEGEKYIFEAGTLTEIVPKEEEADPMEAENEKLKEDLAAAEAKYNLVVAELAKEKELIGSIQKEFTELHAKVTSSFEWEGKEEKKEPKKRSLYKEV